MSIGTGIFLSAALLAIVILFAVTKDRWNWKRITKWGLLAPIAFVAVLSAGIYAYTLWENRPTPQVTFNEIRLGATPADVKFAKGEPTSMDGPDRWIYDVGTGSTGQDAAKYLIQFKEGRIRFILYTASESQIVNPYLLGFTLGASYQDVGEKLGQPSHLTKSADDLDRMFSYDKLNVFFSFKKGRAIAYGMYQPADGPMKFRNEAAASAPSK